MIDITKLTYGTFHLISYWKQLIHWDSLKVAHHQKNISEINDFEKKRSLDLESIQQNLQKISQKIYNSMHN